MRRRALPSGLGTAALAMLTGWFALWAWRPMVEQPQHMLYSAFACAAIIAVVGSFARAFRVPVYVVPFAQVLGVLLFLNVRYESGRSWHAVVPTADSLRALVHLLRLGAHAIEVYASPVSAQRPEVYPYLTVCGVGILLAIDLLACGLGRVPLAGLPLLLTLSIPISILQTGLSIPVFVVTALLFLLLLATEEIRRVLSWGHAVADSNRRRDSLDNVVTGSSVRSAALRIGAVTTLGAVLLPLLVPLPQGWFGNHHGTGPGTNPTSGVQIVNPLVDLRRDLARQTHTPLVFAATDDPHPSYLRLTVLDQFNGDEWKPSARVLPTSNTAQGRLPAPPGLDPDVPGATHRWNVRLASTFETAWLPTPYPTRRLDVPGDWRYDVRTLDVVNPDDPRLSRGLAYSLTSFVPDFSGATMNSAISAPGAVQAPGTALPRNLPRIIARTAARVTRGAPTDYQRIQKLQDWFRSSGGFTYSTDQAPGSGMAELARFITTDKVGFCEQFAAAMAVMARTLGIPARVSVGFLHPAAKTGGTYTFTTDNLHAWPEVYFTGLGWVPFEPTPAAHTGPAPSWTQARLPNAVPGDATPTPTPAVTRGGARDVKKTSNTKTSSTGSTPLWLPAGALVLLLLLLAAAPRALRDARRRRRLGLGQDPAAYAEGLWQELRASATDLGVSWPASRSVRTTIRALALRVRPSRELAARLEELVLFVERARYARSVDVTADEQATLRATVLDLVAELRRTVSPVRARVASVWPRSVLTRGVAAPVDVRSEPRVEETV